MSIRAKYIEPMPVRLPSRCTVCHAWPSAPICDVCVAAFASGHARCQRCALPVTGSTTVCGACILHPPPLDACRAAVPYSYPWSELIARFKFGQQPGWARQFAQILRSTPWVGDALEQADWVIPMPLSKERLAERGYNQAWELAKHLVGRRQAHHTQHKLRANLLLRIAHTPPQPGLPRQQRIRNVSQAFAVHPLHAAQVAGRRIALVDDVMTSGASLFSAAATLKRAGAAHITGIVIARTDAPDTPDNPG